MILIGYIFKQKALKELEVLPEITDSGVHQFHPDENVIILFNLVEGRMVDYSRFGIGEERKARRAIRSIKWIGRNADTGISKTLKVQFRTVGVPMAKRFAQSLRMSIDLDNASKAMKEEYKTD